MRSAKSLALIALCCILPMAWSASPQGNAKAGTASLQQEFEKNLPKMGSDNLSEREIAQKAWQEICIKASAPGNESMRAEACKLMIPMLGPQTPDITRLWLLKQLQAIGRGECVDAVAAVLDDKDDQVSDAAVRCLATNPAPEATAKLIAKLPSANPKLALGLVNALGYRNDKAAVESLVKQVNQNGNANMVMAAARSLGKIATPEAAKALAEARGQAKDRVRLEITDAWLRCADQWVTQGKTESAAAIYHALNKDDEPRPIRLAAFEGTLKTASDNAGDLVLRALAGKDLDAQNIDTGMIVEINPAAIKTVATGMDKLPGASQVKVLNALAARGDKSQMPTALSAAKSNNESIKQAGLAALGKLGDATVVPLLLESLKANGTLATAARESLGQVAGKGVNEELIAALDTEKDAGRRGQLIGILESRRVIAAVPTLLKDVHGQDPALRKRAMTALQKLAEPEHVAAMTKAVLMVPKGAERDEMERAVVLVCAKIVEPEKRPDPVLAVYLDTPPAERPALLPLLGRLGGPRALVLIRSALAAPDAALQQGAFLGLCNWPEPSVSDDLLKLVEQANEPSRRKLAYRALIRVNSIPTVGANREKLPMLQKAMDLAQGPDDKKLLLQGLATVKEIETLHYVLPYLDIKELSHEACKTVVELAHSKTLRLPHQAEFVQALDRVIVLCQQTDKALAERAKGYKQGN
jgi:HEAT repeat protein